MLTCSELKDLINIVSGGSRISRRGGVDLQRGCFSAKMHAKMKELCPIGGGVCAWHAPLDPPMICHYCFNASCIGSKFGNYYKCSPIYYRYISLHSSPRSNYFLTWVIRGENGGGLKDPPILPCPITIYSGLFYEKKKPRNNNQHRMWILITNHLFFYTSVHLSKVSEHITISQLEASTPISAIWTLMRFKVCFSLDLNLNFCIYYLFYFGERNVKSCGQSLQWRK